jgi:hypothetical protein
VLGFAGERGDDGEEVGWRSEELRRVCDALGLVFSSTTREEGGCVEMSGELGWRRVEFLRCLDSG